MDRISIILPCYNEEKRLAKSLDLLKENLDKYGDYSFTYVLVNDGSKDNTKEVASKYPFIHLVTYEENRGKGYAIKEGLKYSLENLDSEYLIFMDVDLSTDLEALPKTIEELKSAPFVVGSRYDKESQLLVKQPFKRRFISKCSRIIIKSMFHLKVKDTQCGYKGMNKEVAQLFVDKSLIERFAFDVEFLYIAKLNKIPYKSIPVIWRDDRASTITVMSSSFKFFNDLFYIKRNKKKYLR